MGEVSLPLPATEKSATLEMATAGKLAFERAGHLRAERYGTEGVTAFPASACLNKGAVEPAVRE